MSQKQSVMAYKVCPVCEASALLHVSQCSRCGHQYRTRFVEPLKQTQIIQMDPAGAPISSTSRQSPSYMPLLPAQSPSYAPVYSQTYPRKDKTAAGLLAFFLGGLGVHGFYMGNIGMGLCILLVNLFVMVPLAIFTAGYCAIPVGIFLIVQAIVYFASSDEEFHQKFIVEQRWL